MTSLTYSSLLITASLRAGRPLSPLGTAFVTIFNRNRTETSHLKSFVLI
jgi:hypothetical protein